MTSTLENSELTISEGVKSDCERLRIFLKGASPFPGSEDSILKSLEDPKYKTLILCDNESMIRGFVQVFNTEILFIAVDKDFRRRKSGKKLYEYSRDLLENTIPGFYARAESEIARKFWEGVGFKRQDNYYWSYAFKRASHNEKNSPCITVSIDVCTDCVEKLEDHFETQSYVADNAITLKNHFIHYIQSPCHLLHISIGNKQLEPKKIKYAKEYGVKIEDSRWAIITEIPIDAISEVK